jgi:hypothetical protein
MKRTIYEQGSDGDTLMMSLAGDKDDGDEDDVGGNECGSDLSPCHRPDLLPIVIQWADRAVADTISRTDHGKVGITAESYSSHHRPRCRRPETLSPPGHSTLYPLLFLKE